MSNFQTILIAIFLAFFVFGVLVFSGILPVGGNSNTQSTPQGKVVIWGTFSGVDFTKVFDNMNSTNRNLSVSYVSKSEETYEQDLLKAFANGTGPDLFFITPDMVLKNKDFIYKMPYTSYPEKAFRDTFIDGADIYLDADGVIAMPVVVDPLVVYYNKNLLSNEGIAKVPQTWDELFTLNDLLTKKESDGTINQSMIALGTFENINHAKDILSALLIQSGTPIVTKSGDRYVPTLVSSSTSPVKPTETVMNFFTEFSNPTSTAYSWNRGLVSSKDFFTGARSAFYIGYGSELFEIEATNPNLSFDVAELFQTQGANRRNLSNIYALAVNKSSLNINAAFGVAGLMSSGANATEVATSLSLPPASRALLASKPSDPYLNTFFNASITARSWLDPDKNVTNAIFSEMVENILSNRLSLESAISKAQGQMDLLLR